MEPEDQEKTTIEVSLDSNIEISLGFPFGVVLRISDTNYDVVVPIPADDVPTLTGLMDINANIIFYQRFAQHMHQMEEENRLRAQIMNPNANPFNSK